MHVKKLLSITILLIYCLVPGALAAGVHGAVYSWSDFEEPLQNVIVEVNSTPTQSKVTTDGTYSFELPPGSYLITAKYYENNILEYSTEEEILIDSEGDFTIDLLLFPPTGMEDEFLVDINLTDVEINNEETGTNYIVIAGLLLFIAIAVLYLYRNEKKQVQAPENEIDINVPSFEETSSITGSELPDDLRELLGMIHGMGGRVTQKELRTKVHCSEAKVSLMITDLENRGLITKVKKGRANVIIATDRT